MNNLLVFAVVIVVSVVILYYIDSQTPKGSKGPAKPKFQEPKPEVKKQQLRRDPPIVQEPRPQELPYQADGVGGLPGQNVDVEYQSF